MQSDDDEKALVRCTSRLSSKLNYERYEDYDGCPVGTYTLDDKGNTGIINENVNIRKWGM